MTHAPRRVKAWGIVQYTDSFPSPSFIDMLSLEHRYTGLQFNVMPEREQLIF